MADRFRERLRDVEKNDTDASKPVARHFNLPNHSHRIRNMTICGLFLHHGITERGKNLEQKQIFQHGLHFFHTGSMNASHSTDVNTFPPIAKVLHIVI